MVIISKEYCLGTRNFGVERRTYVEKYCITRLYVAQRFSRVYEVRLEIYLVSVRYEINEIKKVKNTRRCFLCRRRMRNFQKDDSFDN